MSERTVANSKVELAQLMMPSDANPAGNVHGGTIMKIIDQAATIAAIRHTHKNCVTASVDKLDFISPVFIGNVIFALSSINYVGKTSMEIGVRVEGECLKTGTRAHVASSYLTFVALGENDKPTEIPKIIPETPDEKRRYEEAKARRDARIRTRKKYKHESFQCLTRIPGKYF